MKPYRYNAVLACQSFVSSAIIILCIRQLSAFVGNSILHISIILSVFCLALGFGYKKGASYKNNLATILTKRLIIAAAWIGIGLSYCFILLFFGLFEKNISSQSLAAFFAYIVVIIIPVAYYLGQTYPLRLALLQQQSGNRANGNLVFWISGGACLGFITTSVLFMHNFGVQITVLLNVGILFLLAILLTKTMLSLKNTILIAIILTFIIFFNYQETKMHVLASNEYSNYLLVRDRSIGGNRQGTVFAINHSASSFSENGTLQGFSYIEKIKDILFGQLKLQNKNILVLGAGSFSLSAANTYNNNFLYVDIDPNLKHIVTEHKISNVNGEFIAADAREFLRKNYRSYDVIVSDVFGHKTSIPLHLISREYFTLVSKNINDNGMAVFNIIMSPFLKDNYSVKLDNTIRSAFKFCSTTIMDHASETSNVIYLCTNNGASSKYGFYSDNNDSAILDAILG